MDETKAQYTLYTNDCAVGDFTDVDSAMRRARVWDRILFGQYAPQGVWQRLDDGSYAWSDMGWNIALRRMGGDSDDE